MAKIKTLKNWNEDHTKRVPIAPRTHVKAVFDDNGNTLDSLLGVQDEKLSELGSKLMNISFDGKGTTMVYQKVNGLIPGHSYRLFVRQSWDTTGLPSEGYCLIIKSNNGIESVDLTGFKPTNNIPSYVDFIVPNDNIDITIGIRANEGEQIWFYVYDLYGEKYTDQSIGYIEKKINIAVTSASDIPNIDREGLTLDLGSDPILYIGNNTYALRALHEDKNVYRSISLPVSGSNSGALKVIFNIKTNRIYTRTYKEVIDSDEIVIGGVRLYYNSATSTFSFEGANLPFEYTIDKKRIWSDEVLKVSTEEKERNNVSLITSSGDIPNVDTINVTLDLGSDPVLCVGSKSYALRTLHEDKNVYRHIPLTVSGSLSGAIKLVFNMDNYTIYPLVYKQVLSNNEVLVGGARLYYNSTSEQFTFESLNVPFDYTINGKKIWSKDMALISANQINCKNNMSVIAHRGFHLNGIPENSLDAFRYAGYCGFEYVETDFCPTADDELVLMHDASINRTMYNKSDYTPLSEIVNVRDKTLAELQQSYVLIANDKRMRRPIPTLEEFFITCKNSGVFPIPEIKTSGTTNAHVQKAYELGKKIMGEGNFGFCSFSNELLDYARTLSEKTLLLYINGGVVDTVNSLTGNDRASEYTWWYPSYEGYGLSEETVRAHKDKGIKVAAWTPPVDKFDELMKMGVDVLATDHISPSVANRSGVVVRTDTDFNEIETDGVVDGSILKLSQGKSVSYLGSSLWLGGFYISVVGKGNFTITAPNLNVSVIGEVSDRYIYQGLINNRAVQFSITANDESEIEFIEFSAVKF